MYCGRGSAIFLAVVAAAILLAGGCKDKADTNPTSKTSKCNNHLNDSEWNDAIEACSELKTDSGYHKAAQAYMGRSGVGILPLALDMANSSTSATKLIFDKIPDTAGKKSDYLTALRLIMESVEKQTDIMYLESILLTGMLIFGELKNILNVKLVEDAFTTCVGPAGSDLFADCSFDASADASKLTFTGLGSDFYDAICGASDSTTDTSSGDPPGIARDVTIYGCDIQTNSVLHYNKTASAEYSKVGAKKVVTSAGALNFYAKMDTGGNFHGKVDSLADVYLCKDTNHTTLKPEKPVANDGRLNDCETLNYFKKPGF